MAFRKQPYAFLLLFALSTLLSFIINSSNAADSVGSGAISTYWGQYNTDYTNEGTLKEACETGKYNIVILDNLIVFDDGTASLSLSQHCGGPPGPSTIPCSKLEDEIKYCQNHGIKVFLSIGLNVFTKRTRDLNSILASSSSSSSNKDVNNAAKKLANYLWEKFLSGKAGPLGKVSLDGIDIQDVLDNSRLPWDELVKEIKKSATRKIYLSAAPECVYPGAYLDKAIQTGLFDYIWVEFFYSDPSCRYSAAKGAGDLLKAWGTWTSKVPNSKIFLGLTAFARIPGYIPPDVLKSDVLPKVKNASNYGGVMIWNRYLDELNDYSGQIKDSVPKSMTNFYGLQQGRPFPI